MEELKKIPKHFPKIREARELLMSYAVELINIKLKIIEGAMKKGDFETADNAVNWLTSHMPPDELGTTVIEADIDKPKQVIQGSSLPVINIGFALGGITSTKALPEPVVEVIDVEEGQ